MAVHPLRPATDRRFGGPLPRQLANQTRTHPVPMNLFTQGEAPSCAYAVLPAVSSCYPPVRGRLSTRYSPVRHYDIFQTEIIYISPFDLHVLGTPPAFILSQDQTLMLNKKHPVNNRMQNILFHRILDSSSILRSRTRLRSGTLVPSLLRFSLCSEICLVWFVQTFSLKFSSSDVLFDSTS